MGTPLDQASSFFIPPFVAAGSHNAIALYSQNLTNVTEFGALPLKRPRNSYGAPLNPLQNAPPVSTMPPPPNLRTNPPPNPSNRRVNSMFFKTRLCHKFKVGFCPYGNKCSFAHGVEELRQPPPNWEELVAKERTNGNDQQQRMHKNKICRKFYNEGVCPYGDRCTYLHVEREREREHETSGMALGYMVRPEQGGNGSGSYHSDSNWRLTSTGDCNDSNQKPNMTTCYQWETTGHCFLGERCIFAHGSAEIKKSGDLMEFDGGKIGAASLKPLPNPSNDGPPMKAESTSILQTKQKKKGAFPKLAKKLSCIYADWIDDTMLLPHLSKKNLI